MPLITSDTALILDSSNRSYNGGLVHRPTGYEFSLCFGGGQNIY